MCEMKNTRKTFPRAYGLRPTAGQQANRGSSVTQCSDCVWVGAVLRVMHVIVIVVGMRGLGFTRQCLYSWILILGLQSLIFVSNFLVSNSFPKITDSVFLGSVSWSLIRPFSDPGSLTCPPPVVVPSKLGATTRHGPKSKWKVLYGLCATSKKPKNIRGMLSIEWLARKCLL